MIVINTAVIANELLTKVEVVSATKSGRSVNTR